MSSRSRASLVLIPLEADFSVCKLASAKKVAWEGSFTALAMTDDELSLVCETRLAPDDALSAEHGWRALRIAGSMAFDETGIIAGITETLAAKDVGVFVISTYDTDYILIKEIAYRAGVSALSMAGYKVI